MHGNTHIYKTGNSKSEKGFERRHAVLDGRKEGGGENSSHSWGEELRQTAGRGSAFQEICNKLGHLT